MARLTRFCPTCQCECTIDSVTLDGYEPKYPQWVNSAADVLTNVQHLLKGRAHLLKITQKELHWLVARLLREKPR